jgi:hypothetical protein
VTTATDVANATDVTDTPDALGAADITDTPEVIGATGTSSVSGGPHRRWIAVLVCGVLPAALIAAMVAVSAALGSRLPEGGSFVGLMIAILGVGIVRLGWDAAQKWTPQSAYSADSSGWRLAPSAAAGIISLGLFMIAFVAAVAIHLAVANIGGGRLTWAGAGSDVATLGGPALLAALAGHVLRRYGGFAGADDRFPRSSLGLRAGERAVWTGRAHSRWPFSTWLLVALAGSVCFPGALHWDLTDALPLVVLITIGLLGFTSVRVTVAARGVTVGYGVLGLRLTRIPLRAIAWAEATEQGKFGFTFPFTGSLLLQGQASVVLRSGPALRLTLRDGKTFLVTVDDAATGAALLNDLIAGLPDHGLPDHGASGS